MEKRDAIITNILDGHKPALGRKYSTYYNHVMRIYNYCLLLDDNLDNYEKYAISAAFHDIGIWTHGTFDYLEPSIGLAQAYLTNAGKTKWAKEVGLMIEYHHKISGYKGDCGHTVNVFRKADWIDVSMFTMRFGLSVNQLKSIRKQYPVKGFHTFLGQQTWKWFLKKPLSPLPMFKR